MLLIDGARRAGKSYAAEVFAKASYKPYILIDFNETGQVISIDLFTCSKTKRPVWNRPFSL